MAILHQISHSCLLGFWREVLIFCVCPVDGLDRFAQLLDEPLGCYVNGLPLPGTSLINGIRKQFKIRLDAAVDIPEEVIPVASFGISATEQSVCDN